MNRFIPNPEKKVDESWKERVSVEKAAPVPEAPAKGSLKKEDASGAAESSEVPKNKPQPASSSQKNEGAFTAFLSTLAMQAYVALGDMEDPATGTIHPAHLPQAKYMIDLLGLLEEKTTGNLSQEENHYLTGLLYELRMRYVEKTQPPVPQSMPPVRKR